MEAVSFTDCLTELALCAKFNARPSITTQAAPERADEQNMPTTPRAGVATDLETEDNRSAVRALDEQLRITRILNRLQTTRRGAAARRQLPERGARTGGTLTACRPSPDFHGPSRSAAGPTWSASCGAR